MTSFIFVSISAVDYSVTVEPRDDEEKMSLILLVLSGARVQTMLRRQ
jgi:hypothetical protein